MKYIKAINVLSLEVTGSLEEVKGNCFIKIQMLDVTAEAVSQKLLPKKQICKSLTTTKKDQDWHVLGTVMWCASLVKIVIQKA